MPVKGPGTTYDYHKKAGKPVYTGKGQFTIVRVSDGPGAKQWGLLWLAGLSHAVRTR